MSDEAPVPLKVEVLDKIAALVTATKPKAAVTNAAILSNTSTLSGTGFSSSPIDSAQRGLNLRKSVLSQK